MAYQIWSPADLQAIGSNTGAYAGWTMDASYILMADIDWSSEPAPFSPITGIFTGELDGAGYTISNLDLAYDNTTDNVAMFQTFAGTAKNLTWNNATVTGKDKIAILAVTARTCTIDNCHLTNCNVTGIGTTKIAGFIVDTGNSTYTITITNSTITDTDIEATNIANTGGFIGEGLAADTIILTGNTVTRGILTNTPSTTVSERYIGSIAGRVRNATITNCHVIGTKVSLSSGSTYWGSVSGFLGRTELSNITNCTVKDLIVEGYQDIRPAPAGAGFIAYSNNDTIENCRVDETEYIAQTGEGVGGFIGSLWAGTVKNCHVKSNKPFHGAQQSGGFIGQVYGFLTGPAALIEDCTAEQPAPGWVSDPLGGFIGRVHNRAEIKRCRVLGAIGGSSTPTYQLCSSVGGLIGIIYAGAAHEVTVEDCYVEGTVQGRGRYSSQPVGGLFGRMQRGIITATNCYFAGEIISTHAEYAGAIGGEVDVDTTTTVGVYFDSDKAVRAAWGTTLGDGGGTHDVTGATTADLTYPYGVGMYDGWMFPGHELWDGTYVAHYIVVSSCSYLDHEATRTTNPIPVIGGQFYTFSGGNRCRLRWTNSASWSHCSEEGNVGTPITVQAPLEAEFIEYYYTNEGHTDASVVAETGPWTSFNADYPKLASEPIEIEIWTADDLQAIGSNTGVYLGWTMDSTYKIMADIDWAPQGVLFVPLGVVFNGTLLGNGKTISNLDLRYSNLATDLTKALFERLNGTVRDLTFVGAQVNAYEQCAVLAAQLRNATVDNCHVINSTITGVKFHVGGLFSIMGSAGYVASVSNCTLDNVTMSNGRGYLGGIISEVYNPSEITITNCHVTNSHITSTLTEFYSNNHRGGLVGYLRNSTVSGCSVTDTTLNFPSTSYAYGNLAGLISAAFNSTIESCTVERITVVVDKVNVSGPAFCGLINTASSCTILNCHSIDYKYLGSLSSDLSPLLGTVLNSTVSGCTVKTPYEVYGTAESSGLIAELNGTCVVEDCHVEANVRSTSMTSASGLIGTILHTAVSQTIRRCSYRGNVAVGHGGSIFGNRSYGTVLIEDSYVRGIITSGYEGSYDAGGIVAKIWGGTVTVRNVYLDISISVGSRTGVVVGGGVETATLTTEGVYVNNDRVYGTLLGVQFYSTHDPADVTEATEIDMTTPYGTGIYSGWDFVNVWSEDASANDGFPYLLSEPADATLLTIFPSSIPSGESVPEPTVERDEVWDTIEPESIGSTEAVPEPMARVTLLVIFSDSIHSEETVGYISVRNLVSVEVGSIATEETIPDPYFGLVQTVIPPSIPSEEEVPEVFVRHMWLRIVPEPANTGERMGIFIVERKLPRRPSSIHILPEELAVAINTEATIMAKFIPTFLEDKRTMWASSDPSVVRVIGNGSSNYAQVRGVGIGVATITAIAVSKEEVTSTISVNVVGTIAKTFDHVRLLDKKKELVGIIDNQEIVSLRIMRELSGNHSMEMTLPINATYADAIFSGRFFEAEGQPYVVQRVTRARGSNDIPKLSVEGVHEFFNFKQDLLTESAIRQASLLKHLQILLDGSDFSIVAEYPDSPLYLVERRMEYQEGDSKLGAINKLFGRFGCGYRLEGLSVHIIPNEGIVPSGAILEYAVNNYSVDKDEDESNVVTQVFATGGSIFVAPGEEAELRYSAEASPEIRALYSKDRVAFVNFGDVKLASNLKYITDQYIQKNQHPRRVYSLDVAQLDRLPGIEEIEPEKVFAFDIGQSVQVIDGELGIGIDQVIRRYSFTPLEPENPANVTLGEKPFDIGWREDLKVGEESGLDGSWRYCEETGEWIFVPNDPFAKPSDPNWEYGDAFQLSLTQTGPSPSRIRLSNLPAKHSLERVMMDVKNSPTDDGVIRIFIDEEVYSVRVLKNESRTVVKNKLLALEIPGWEIVDGSLYKVDIVAYEMGERVGTNVDTGDTGVDLSTNIVKGATAGVKTDWREVQLPFTSRFQDGDVITVQAIPRDEFVIFSHWTGEGFEVETNVEARTFIMDHHMDAIAHFDAISADLSVSTDSLWATDDTNANVYGAVMKMTKFVEVQRGFCWAHHRYPTLSDTTVYVPNGGLGSFTATITKSGTEPMYVRAYARVYDNDLEEWLVAYGEALYLHFPDPILPRFKVSISRNQGTLSEGAKVSPFVGTGQYSEGHSLTIAASTTELSKWEFTEWTINGATMKNKSITLTIKENMTIVANFEEAGKGPPIAGKCLKGFISSEPPDDEIGVHDNLWFKF